MRENTPCISLAQIFRIRNFSRSVVECLKDRTEGFDDYHPGMKEEYVLEHVYKWTALFVFMYNAVRSHIKFRLLIYLT